VKSIHDIMRERLLASVLKEEQQKMSLAERRKEQWSNRFEQLMRQRLLMGSYRYGPFRLQPVGRYAYDYPGDALRRIQEYIDSGNMEHLIDVANLCLLEFEHGTHPKKHFAATDDGTHNKQRR